MTWSKRPSFRAWAVALFCTFHLGATLLYVLPYPPYFDAEALAHPEAREELNRIFIPLHRLIPVTRDAGELEDTVLAWVRGYTNLYFSLRKLVEPYIHAAGLAQSWNMFGGTPPRFPRVFMVEVQPRGTDAFLPFKDFHWGTPETLTIPFRHRKAMELLPLSDGGRQRDYARWWGLQWNAQHPEQPAQQVRLRYLQLTTPQPEQVRAGDTDRHERQVGESTWTMPEAP